MVTIAIVGRPNVGKSTLFNRLIGKRLALVDDQPGVTRDRRIGDGRLADLSFSLIDTAGLEEAAPTTLEGRMRAQTEAAIAEADLVFFLIDVKAGVTPRDTVFGDLLRKSEAPVLLVANKAEAREARAGVVDAYSLGLGDPIAISAEHGEGMGELRDAVVEALGIEAFADPDDDADVALTDVDLVEPAQATAAGGEPGEAAPVPHPDAGGAALDALDRPLRVAIVGRPNAGKSTLVNQLLGEERMLTGPEAGITRDAIAVDWSFDGRPIKLFDTAGLRRKARVHEKLEKLSTADALRAVKFAEVVVICLDATIPFERQDLSIADLIVREGRAPVIALNKWDLIEDRQATLKTLREAAERLLPQARGLRVVPIAGETGYGIRGLMRAVIETHRIWNTRISTAKLNRWLEGMLVRHAPPAVSGRRINVKYITQVKSRPPSFVVSTGRPDALGQAYVRYLINGLRENFGLDGVPIRLALRKPANPYANKRKRTS